MAGWHHRLDGRESRWTPGVGDRQRGLACCDSWGHKESDTTEQLNWTELNWTEWARMRTGNSLSSNAKWQIKMLKRRCSISQSGQWKAQQWCRVIFYDQKWQKLKHLTMWGTGENRWKLKILYPLVEVKIVSPLWSVIYQYLIKLKVKSE